MATVTYTVNATLVDGQGWHIEVPEIERVTQARNVGEIESMARDLIEIMTGEPADGVELTMTMSLPSEVAGQLREVQRQRLMEQQARAAAAQASRDAALRLKMTGMSVRDVGKVLGISHQRASQLTSGKAEAG